MRIQDKDNASRWRALLLLSLPLWLLSSAPAAANDLTIGAAGRVSIELISSEAAFRNNLSVNTDTSFGVTGDGCKVAPGLPGLVIISEKLSQRGCRLTLDSDILTDGIQPFAAGTTFDFDLCVDASADAQWKCKYLWRSDPRSNWDGIDHVVTTELYPADFPGQVYRLAWEDKPLGGDRDFNDMIVVVRVEKDSDGDGLWDDWERFGIDTDGNGTIDLDLPALGAKVQRKDIFLEIDWMDCRVAESNCDAGDVHSHRPLPGALTGVIQAFANANVPNPDGSTGITLHIDTSNAFRHSNYLAIPGGCLDTVDANYNFDTVKADPANFGPTNPRRFAYHYVLFTHLQASTTDSSGCAELPGNDVEVSLGGFSDGGHPGRPPAPVGTLMEQAGTLMHELGHNLGLQHGGNNDVNNKPNYISVMNYALQFGIPPTDPDGAGPLTERIDYSKQALPSLSELLLSEPAGIGDGTDNTFFCCPDGKQGDKCSVQSRRSSVGNAAIDWNCNGVATDLGVSSDVNWDAEINSLTGFKDWANLKYDFQGTTDFDDGTHTPVQEPELDREMYEEMIAPELSIAKTALPAAVLTGSNVTYTITVTDQRPEQATGVRVSDLLPPSMTLVSCAATGGGTCGGTGRNVAVDFPVLPGGASAAITLVANLSCSVTDNTMIHNTATVDFSRADSNPANDVASATVTALNPPPVLSGVATDTTTLSPPNHKMVDVTVSYKVSDNCGVPICRLAVTSNEPVDDPGSGSTSPDWEILDEHHVRLRAERSGTGSGRVYTIGIACTDDGGATSTATAAVTVPRGRV